MTTHKGHCEEVGTTDAAISPLASQYKKLTARSPRPALSGTRNDLYIVSSAVATSLSDGEILWLMPQMTMRQSARVGVETGCGQRVSASLNEPP